MLAYPPPPRRVHPTLGCLISVYWLATCLLALVAFFAFAGTMGYEEKSILIDRGQRTQASITSVENLRQGARYFYVFQAPNPATGKVRSYEGSFTGARNVGIDIPSPNTYPVIYDPENPHFSVLEHGYSLEQSRYSDASAFTMLCAALGVFALGKLFSSTVSLRRKIRLCRSGGDRRAGTRDLPGALFSEDSIKKHQNDAAIFFDPDDSSNFYLHIPFECELIIDSAAPAE